MTVITNAEGKIWLALQGRLDAWSETDVMMPDTVFKPGADQAFLIVQPVGVDYEDQVFGYTCGTEFRGFLNISPMVPLGWSYASHVGLASRVCDHFVFGSKLTYSDATVEIYARPKVNGPPRLDQSWNRLDLQIPWRCWA